MSIRDCVPGLIADGTITPEQGQQATGLFEELEQVFKRQFGDQVAAGMASDQAIAALKRETIQKKRQALLQIRAQQGIRANIERIVADGGRADLAAVAHFDFDERIPGVSNLEARRRAVLGRAHGMMSDVLLAFHKDILGRIRQPAKLDNMVRAAFGEAIDDDAAREMAKAWGTAAEFLRTKYNAAGGAIGKRVDWGLPQAHDSLRVRQSSFTEWRDFIAPLLDPAKMLDEQTGYAFTPQRLELALKGVYETIRTEGWANIKPGGEGGAGKLANRRADPRFLVFKDADSWLGYNGKYGAADPYSAMMGHIDGMSRDIAALEILGPNPNATVRWMSDTLEKAGAMDGKQKLIDRGSVAKYQIETIWGAFTGELNRPVNATVARGFATFRAVQTAAKLGGAAITAITDLGFQRVTAKFNGIGFRGILGGYLKQLNPLDAADRQIAIRSGLIAEEYSQRATAVSRYVDDTNTPEIARRLVDGVLRLSGLSALTQAGKWAFGMEFMGSLADNAGLAFGALKPEFREALQRYGIGEGNWDIIRSTPLYDHRGASLLRPDELAARTDLAPSLADSLSTKLLEMIQSEQRFAVPEASLRTKAAMTANARPGTVGGELARSVMQFKAFPVTIIQTHLMRAALTRGAMGKAAYMGHLFAGTTLMGALALQLKQIASGKDPRDMTDGAFWPSAIMQGGGVGIFGDFLLADQNRFGGSLTDTLAGPGLSTASDFLKLTAGNVQQGLNGDDTNAGKELVRFLKQNTPGSSLWYSRLALERIVFDELQSFADPDYRQGFRTMERNARKNFDQGYWWRPGEIAPDRAPDLGNAAGGSQ